MPTIVACTTCETKLKVPENSTAKALRCPKCKGVVPIAAPPKPPPPVVEEEEFEVNEAVEEQDEEFEVNEAVDDESEDEDSPLAELGFARVKDVYEKGNVPKEARDAIEKTFVKKEAALWAGRPNKKLCESSAWIGLVAGPIAILVGLGIFTLMLFMPVQGNLGLKLGLIAVGAIFFLAFGGVGVLAIVFRKRIGGDANDCYVVTNQRAYIFVAHGKSVRAFSPKQLENMVCHTSSKLDGAGDLVFGYDLHGQGLLLDQSRASEKGTTAVGFLNIEDVQLVRQMMYDVLIDPQLDKAKKKRKQRRFL